MSKIFTVFIMLFPLLSIYASPISILSYGELILAIVVVCMFIHILKNDTNIKYTPFYYYLLYALISTIILSLLLKLLKSGFSVNDMLQRVLRDSFYFAIIVVFGPIFFDFQFGKKLLKGISILLCLYMIIQVTVFMLLKVYIPGIIPWAKTTISGGAYGAEVIEHFAKDAQIDGYARGVGFFSEPAVSAQFLTVALLFELFSKSKRKRWSLIVLYTVGMLVTVSVNAYVALAVCFIIFILYSNRKNSKRLFISMILCAILAVAALSIAESISLTVWERITELFSGNMYYGSSSVRVFRGPAFYMNMPLFYRLFGSGFGNFVEFKNAYDISTVYEVADEYLNTNAYILISSGLIGFILYVVMLYKHIKHRVAFSKAMLLLVLVYGLSCSIYSSAQFVIMLLFLMNAPLKKEVNKNESKHNYAS